MIFLDFKKLFRSFKHAFSGIKWALKEEQNFRLQLIFGFLVLLLAVYFQVKTWELTALIITILVVLVLELINTIFEKFVDILKPRVHHYVLVIKDLMAAAVLIASIGAIVIGLLIFLPYIL